MTSSMLIDAKKSCPPPVFEHVTSRTLIAFIRFSSKNLLFAGSDTAGERAAAV